MRIRRRPGRLTCGGCCDRGWGCRARLSGSPRRPGGWRGLRICSICLSGFRCSDLPGCRPAIWKCCGRWRTGARCTCSSCTRRANCGTRWPKPPRARRPTWIELTTRRRAWRPIRCCAPGAETPARCSWCWRHAASPAASTGLSRRTRCPSASWAGSRSTSAPIASRPVRPWPVGPTGVRCSIRPIVHCRSTPVTAGLARSRWCATPCSTSSPPTKHSNRATSS